MAGAEPLEIEVKLGVLDPGPLRALIDAGDAARLAGFESAGEAHDVVVLDRYLDTALRHGALEASGLRARLRFVGGRVILTVKDEGRRDGDVHERLELEGPATPDLDPRAWPASAARDRVAAVAGGGPLLVVAEVGQERRTRRLARGVTAVELSLDVVEARDGERRLARRLELEAELVHGDPDALAALAAALRAVPGVVGAYGSKWRFARAAREAETER